MMNAWANALTGFLNETFFPELENMTLHCSGAWAQAPTRAASRAAAGVAAVIERRDSASAPADPAALTVIGSCSAVWPARPFARPFSSREPPFSRRGARAVRPVLPRAAGDPPQARPAPHPFA